MMQKLPFLVAQTNPSKNTMTTKQPNEKMDKTEDSNSFKQVLSKQVEQEASKKTLEQAKSSQGKSKEDKNTSSALENSSSEDTSADAQLIASAVTAKAISEVTDGEVVLEVPKSDASISNVMQSADSVPSLMVNIMQGIQPTNQIEFNKKASEPLVKDMLVQTNFVDVETISKDKVDLTSVATGRVDKLAQDSQAASDQFAKNIASDKMNQADASVSKADASVQGDQFTNHKFANYLASANTRQLDQDSATAQSISPLVDANSLATMASQATAKILTQPMTPVEQAGFNQAINITPGKAGWSEAIGQKVVWMVGAGEQSATITLNPKDLGPLQVIIQVNNEKADATFISENPEVRKALEEGMSGLRQSMGQAGVELGQANVNTGKQHQEFQQASKEYIARQRNDNNASLEASQLQNRPVSTHISRGLVDTFV